VAFRTEAVKDEGYDQVLDQFRPHVRNFLDSVKSRQAPVSDLEGGHQTAVACHLANIAARVGRVVHWNAKEQTIVGDPEASVSGAAPIGRLGLSLVKAIVPSA
jgi:hypothetical protein